MKARVFRVLARETEFGTSLDTKPGRARRILRAIFDAVSRAPAKQPVEEFESRIRKARAAGGLKAAATEAIREVGPSVLEYLLAVLRNEEEASEAFSNWGETLWRGLSTYQGPLSFKAWAFQLAREEALKLREEPWRRRSPVSSEADPSSHEFATVDAAAISNAFRALSGPPLEEKLLDKLRESLTAEERSLLVLRIDQGLAWTEIARIMAQGGTPADPTALNKRFEQLKARLAQLARDQGLLALPEVEPDLGHPKRRL